MDQHAIDAMRHDTPESRPSLRELNEQWAARNREPRGVRDREQRWLDHQARHAALIDSHAYLKEIKHLLGRLLLCTLLLLFCTLLLLFCALLGRVPLSGG